MTQKPTAKQKPRVTNNERQRDAELEQDARIALLQHYSSKSSNQVTSALTIALIFFAFITAFDTLNRILGSWATFVFSLAIASFVALGVHTVIRLLYWGKLAGYAYSADFVTSCCLKKTFEGEQEDIVKNSYTNCKKNSKLLLDDFRRNFEEEQINDGLPTERDYGSASLNMRRLVIGCFIDFKNATKVHRWQQLMLFSGWSDPLFFTMAISLIAIGAYGIYDFFTKVNVINVTETVTSLVFILTTSVGLVFLMFWVRDVKKKRKWLFEKPSVKLTP
jgi:hypothetical protein